MLVQRVHRFMAGLSYNEERGMTCLFTSQYFCIVRGLFRNGACRNVVRSSDSSLNGSLGAPPKSTILH